MGVWAPGYMWTYVEDAFEVSGNSITYNFEIFEFGYAGPPEVVDLHDIPNDQGRQMRAVWHTGNSGRVGLFYSVLYLEKSQWCCDRSLGLCRNNPMAWCRSICGGCSNTW